MNNQLEPSERRASLGLNGDSTAIPIDARRSGLWRIILHHDLRVPLVTLALASVLGVALIAVRMLLTWRGQYLFLVWNLFLAWIPVVLALWLEERDQRGLARGWRLWSAAIAWLMFFPNAPYILTDLKHLKLATRPHWWTDLIIILLFAFTGLVLAFLALHRMHGLVARRRGWIAGWVFVLGVVFLSGFGVYLGRFERWNSWDVLVQPLAMAADSPNWFHYSSAKFTILFGLLLATAYALLYSLTRLGTGVRVPAWGSSARTTNCWDVTPLEIKLRRRIRLWTWAMIVGLVLSGVTALPLQTELDLMARWLGAEHLAPEQATSGFVKWILIVRGALHATNAKYPFLAYGTDWLAFAHIVIAIAFVGALRHPLRNSWLFTFGMIASVLMVPWALFTGQLRDIPIYWRLIDCSFAVGGFIPCWLCYKWARELERLHATNLRFD